MSTTQSVDIRHCLQYYLSTTTLPEMSIGKGVTDVPPEGHKSHRNFLSTAPSPHRKLESMHSLNEDMLETDIFDFMKNNVPAYAHGALDADPLTREKITIPNKHDSSIPHLTLGEPHTMMDLHMWLLLFPLKTVERIIHFLYPHTRQYRPAMRGFRNVDADIFQYIKWGIHNPRQVDPDIDDPTPSVLIVVQPPWILTYKDLESFARCSEFPEFDVKDDNPPFRSKDRLWAKLWDLSVEKTCPWFVVTTYWGWVFGVFSKGMTRAFVSQVKRYSDEGPTILEYLTYWLCSSMDIPGCFTVPEVAEPVRNVASHMSLSTPDPALRQQSVAVSESWSGISGETNYHSYNDLSRSDNTVGPTAKLPHPRSLAPREWSYTAKVNDWMGGQLATREEKPDWREPSVPLSDTSDDSTVESTVMGFGNRQVFEGGWLTGDPGEAHGMTYRSFFRHLIG